MAPFHDRSHTDPARSGVLAVGHTRRRRNGVVEDSHQLVVRGHAVAESERSGHVDHKDSRVVAECDGDNHHDAVGDYSPAEDHDDRSSNHPGVGRHNHDVEESETGSAREEGGEAPSAAVEKS